VKRRGARAGFTLAEIAVTIVIVGIGLLLVLQGLNTAKLTAAHTRNMKLARELGMLTLGQVASGMLQEDIESGYFDTYAEEGYPDFTFEIMLGDDVFREPEDDGSFNSWDPELDEEDEDEDEEEVEEPYEEVRVRVTYPAIKDLPNQLTLEQWIPWKQVHGEDEDAEQEPEKTAQESP
jgi:prepilin-type N-terminal cleavage/methylation domain-containing protein